MVNSVEFYHGESSSPENFDSPRGYLFFGKDILERGWESRGKVVRG
jgi:hypothetical protein